MYIKTSGQLLEYLKDVEGTPLLALDTEFLRERSYYPQLCLLQLATERTCVIVDPLTMHDLSPLAGILTDPAVTKIVHAGDQDCAIIMHVLGVVPKPLFDTQRAAQLFGHPNQMGLGALVKAFCGVSLSKADSFTDWYRRPLTDAQIDYALDDVRYLPRIYNTMAQELHKNGRYEWLTEDFEHMSDPATYANDPYDRWMRVKRSSSLNPRQLAVVREVAAWRELTAQKRDYPRKWILTDELVVEVAKRAPRTLEELHAVRGLKDKLGDQWSREVLRAVGRALDLPQSELPQRSREHINKTEYTAAIDLLTTLLHCRARENQVTSTFIASHDDLVALAAGVRRGLALMEGWRYELVGREMIDLLEGRLALRLQSGSLKVTET